MVPHTATDILDVGCSNGALGRALLVANPSLNICGIEYDNTFSREAAIHLNQVINADLNVLDWQETWSNRTFDCVIFADVLEHLIDPRACLLQAFNHLRSDGCIIISLPNIRHISAFKSIYINGHFPQRERGIFDKTHLRWYTIRDAHDLIESCGLQVVEQSNAMRWGDVGGGQFNRLLNRLPNAIKTWAPIRELLTYQVCLRVVPAP